MYTVSMNLQQRYLCNHQTHISHRAPRPAGCCVAVAVAVAGGSGRVRKEKKGRKKGK